MPTSSIAIYNLDDISDVYISEYFNEEVEIADAERAALFRQASVAAVGNAQLKEFVRRAQAEGTNLSPEEIGDWLRSAQGASLKTEIANLWSGQLAYTLAGVDAELLERLETTTRFAARPETT